MILILIGSSGSGKSVIAGKLIKEYGYKAVITCTTRKPRSGETGNEYHFLSKEEFKENIKDNKLVEWDVYDDNYYGTLKSSLEEDARLVLVITLEGADAVKKIFPDAFIVHVNPSMKTSVIRAVSRESEINPGIMNRISIRAMQDYHLFKNPYSDFEVANEMDTPLDDVVKLVVDAHEDFIASHMDLNKELRELNGILKDSIKELEKYDIKKKGGS